MSAYRYIDVVMEGRLTIITINRPEVMNALHHPAHLELARAFDVFSTAEDQWVAILTGAGERAFCAGNDIKSQAAGGTLAVPTSGFGGLCERFDLDKPVIAAVNGLALGGGFELALACDLIVAAEHAGFGLPEVGIGLIAFAGGTHRLPRHIGPKRAMDLLLTGRRLAAGEAKALGLVQAMAAPDELMLTARSYAASILKASPLAVRATKEAVYRGLGYPVLADAMAAQSDFPATQRLFAAEDFSEGPRAFLQKRQPEWKNR